LFKHELPIQLKLKKVEFLDPMIKAIF